MIPGMNPKQMQQMMKKMGIQQQEIDATEVIIKTGESDIVIVNPQVSKVNMMGQETYQVVGQSHVREHDATHEIDEEDVKQVMEQCSCSEEEARDALTKKGGDLAGAILLLSSGEE